MKRNLEVNSNYDIAILFQTSEAIIRQVLVVIVARIYSVYLVPNSLSSL